LLWRAFGVAADAATAARHLRKARAAAATTSARPLAAVGIAARHARLVRIEIGFNRALELAQLLLDDLRQQERADGAQSRADLPACFCFPR
jgi:hypothetical protein